MCSSAILDVVSVFELKEHLYKQKNAYYIKSIPHRLLVKDVGFRIGHTGLISLAVSKHFLSAEMIVLFDYLM